MKILMLNYEFPPIGGGASPVSYEIAKGYVKLGHKVDVVTMGFKNLPHFEVVDGFTIYRLPCWRSKKEICYPWEQFSFIISAILFFRKHLKVKNYEINHTHFIIPTGVIALWLKKKYNLNYIITSHGSDVLGYNKRFKYIYPLIKTTWKKILKQAIIVTTPSMFLQEKIKEKIQACSFIIIPNGIDPEAFKPLKKEKRILVVARLFINKGVQDILDAVKGLDMNGWQIDIVGDGPYRDILKKKTEENGLIKVVKFHGWLDNKSQQMKVLYGKAAIFISASYFESLGVVLLEAIASGCYPIATNVGGHPDILPDEYLFEAGDILGLREIIKNILNAYENLTPLKLNDKFRWNVIISKYQKALIYGRA